METTQHMVPVDRHSRPAAHLNHPDLFLADYLQPAWQSRWQMCTYVESLNAGRAAHGLSSKDSMCKQLCGHLQLLTAGQGDFVHAFELCCVRHCLCDAATKLRM